MMRLILFVFLLAGILLAFAAVVTAVKAVAPRHGAAPREDTMPKTFSMIAYILLILLMVGISLGWLGAA